MPNFNGPSIRLAYKLAASTQIQSLTLSAEQLEKFFKENIPLTSHMQISVDSVDNTSLVLSAPLAPNANHHDTAFGGSIASLAVLCGWGWLHHQTQDMDCSLVVQKTTMTYLKPVRGRFTARCQRPPAEAWQRFVETLQKHGRARSELRVEVMHAESLCAELTAIYAARIEQ